jgi:hypothetical protein
MKAKILIRSVCVAATLALGVAFVPGCGDGAGGEAKHANVPSGPMPEGESWTGVYFHPVYGYLHLVEEGSNVVGKWKRADQSKWGELSGTHTGNVLRFAWKEHTVGLVGAGGESTGKGYFVYKMPKSGSIPELDGQYGINNDETGSDWHNVKQQRMTPDLKSISGDTGGLSTPAAGKWD